MRSPISRENAEATCREFNAQCPIGTEVHLVNDFGKVEHTRTRSKAWVLSGNIPVVQVDGRAGGYLLERITPRAAAGPAPDAGRALRELEAVLAEVYVQRLDGRRAGLRGDWTAEHIAGVLLKAVQSAVRLLRGEEEGKAEKEGGEHGH